MDKSKTMEILRSMKFMQRKEEAKRRELFEADQKRRMEERLHKPSAAGSGTSGAGDGSFVTPAINGPSTDTGRKTATIFYDVNFPRELYSHSRLSFAAKALATASSSSVAGAGAEEAREFQQREKEEEDCGSRHGGGAEHSSDDGEYWEDINEKDATAVEFGNKKKRFCVKSNAPKLPKDLERKVSGVKRKRRGGRGE
ncbi:uncharacterized protein TEOVI_000491100 [Trypanosoma equiperdum]|uniref:Uncharacterized protein n=1 Tax=Trypanosoma equiperdum TaxID=5694 RepID=A0A1G4I3L4_TRYEQ|nr:hypothetical protein, conserved [Trypanosoma equiperdum]